MEDILARVLRVAPFTLLGGVACFVSIIAAVDSTDSPYLFNNVMLWVLYSIVALPATATFDLTNELDFIVAIVSATALGIAGAAVLLLVVPGYTFSFEHLSLFAWMVLLGMIYWIIWCIGYFVFFMLGRVLAFAYQKIWRRSNRAAQ